MLPSLRQLEYLVEVARQRSFRRAARACGVSQPGLSAQIRTLEELLDLSLFERDRRRVLPTPAGEALAARARRVLAEAQALVEAARVFTRPLAGPLRLGVIPTVSPYLLPEVLPEVRRRYPELALELREERTDRLVTRLAEGRLDLLLLALEAELGDLETLPLFADPFFLAVPAAHPLARRRSVREADLDGTQVLLLEDGHCLRDQALALCSAHGAVELGDFRATSLATLVQMVASGAAVTLLPQLALAAEVPPGGELVTRPFRAPAPHRTIGLAWRRSSPRAGEYRELAPLLRPRRARRSR